MPTMVKGGEYAIGEKGEKVPCVLRGRILKKTKRGRKCQINEGGGNAKLMKRVNVLEGENAKIFKREKEQEGE